LRCRVGAIFDGEVETVSNPSPLHLGKRERQIVEALYRLGEAPVAQVRAALPDPPSYSAVRAILNVLVDKRVLSYRRDGKRYLYRPTKPKETIRRSALKNLVATFFSGQPVDAVAALLNGSGGRLSPEDFKRMKELIDQAEQTQ
jgi:BlaI family transcriptional regulator, penicillinase repressor